MSADVQLRKGDRVTHAVFGSGVVEEIDMQKRAYIVRFDELDTTRAISFRVKLECAQRS